jgi:HEAT repeat protein
MGNKRRVIFIALLVAVLGLFAWAVIALHEREPVYQGKPLSFWLAGYRLQINGVPIDQNGADEAMRHIGTNTIPTLLHMLRKTDSPLKLKLIAFGQKQNLLKISFTPATIYNHEAEEGFRALGPLGSNAVPELIRLYDHPLSPESQIKIAFMFNQIGPAAEAAAPSLLHGLTNADSGVRYCAILGLGGISAESALVVPALIKCLSDPDTNVQTMAAIVLGGYGKDAKAAVPTLVELAKDQWRSPPWEVAGSRQPHLSDAAAMAVYEIDPKTANQMVAKARKSEPNAPQ